MMIYGHQSGTAANSARPMLNQTKMDMSMRHSPFGVNAHG
jgi:hypothetical protein